MSLFLSVALLNGSRFYMWDKGAIENKRYKVHGVFDWKVGSWGETVELHSLVRQSYKCISSVLQPQNL